LPIGKEVFINLRNRKVEVLLHTRKVCKANVYKLDVVFLDVCQHLRGCLEHRYLFLR